MRDYKALYESWLNDPCFDEETRAELRAIAGDEKEIMERFYMDLEFGTAGLRGILGAGTNRMNKYVIRRATQGLANYIIRKNGQQKGVAIAYDSRHMSPEFSDEAARTLAANGIKAYRFESLRPTPELSFALRELGCIAGINITASHNPSNYNGYKVYWEDGAQFTAPHDKAVMDEVLSITDYSLCKTMSREEAEAKGLYITIGSEIDDKYIAAVEALMLNKDIVAEMADSIRIVYTPLNGTGHVPVTRVLKDMGFTHVYEVPEQAWPDSDFTTVPYPNPEAAASFELALKLAEEKKADIVLATDPDADRLGVYIRRADGSYTGLNGNMTASLICEYLLNERQKRGLIPADGQVVETIVSTDLIKAIAADHGCSLAECLTGFKWICRVIYENELKGRGNFQFGMEESYGCLPGSYTRDKDGIAACALLCEAAAVYASRGMSLWEAMISIYKKYGYYKEYTRAIELKGREGLEKIRMIMDTLRQQQPASFGEYRVLKIRDYQNDAIRDLESGEVTPSGLPKSNVLYYELNDNAWIAARPSGTEPKLKFYCGVKGSSMEDADAKLEMLNTDLGAKVDAILGA